MSLLNYIKQIWDTTSYVNPTRMNYIEDGIYNVSDKVDNLSADNIPYDSDNSVKDKIDESIAYKVGDTVTFDNVYCLGFFENASQLRFMINLPKMTNTISSASVTLTKCEVVCNGSDVEHKNNISSTSISRREPNQIMVIASGSFGSVTIRTSAVVIISGTVAF